MTSTTRRLAATAAALAVATATPVALLGAQAARSGPPIEIRGDVIAGRATALQLALGASVALGNYARASLVAGGGVTSLGGHTRGSGRADAVVRFLLDPFRERRWGPYGGAGVSAMYTGAGGAIGGSGAWRGYLLAVAGLEGPAAHGVLTSFEVGLGGGTRVGLVLRRAPIQGR